MIRLLVALSLAVAAVAADHAAWLAKVEGLYMSQKNPTPFGVIGFAMEMVKQPDGSMHGRLHIDKETFFDFKFWLDDKGDIFFHETGSLPGGFVQSHVLDLVKAEGDTLTFETRKQPGVLVAQVTATGERLRVSTVVRGKPHADLDMARVRDQNTIAGFRAEQARSKDLPGGSALKQAFAGNAAAQVDTKLPKGEQARLHTAEAQKIAKQMGSAAPADQPGLAFKMKGHLDRAVELDPTYDQAQLSLAIWYLRAPELAGGSKAKAQQIQQTLEKQGSTLAEKLQQELTRRP